MTMKKPEIMFLVILFFPTLIDREEMGGGAEGKNDGLWNIVSLFTPPKK